MTAPKNTQNPQEQQNTTDFAIEGHGDISVGVALDGEVRCVFGGRHRCFTPSLLV